MVYPLPRLCLVHLLISILAVYFKGQLLSSPDSALLFLCSSKVQFDLNPCVLLASSRDTNVKQL